MPGTCGGHATHPLEEGRQRCHQRMDALVVPAFLEHHQEWHHPGVLLAWGSEHGSGNPQVGLPVAGCWIVRRGHEWLTPAPRPTDPLERLEWTTERSW